MNQHLEKTEGLEHYLQVSKKSLTLVFTSTASRFIVLNNPYETLDKASVSLLKQQLISLSKEMPIVFIFNRQDDVLPVITHVIDFKNNELLFMELTEFLTIF